MENRVYCLYRVSTEKQVDYNEKNQADIPMQRKICHRFAEEHGWTIVHEEQEDGISGHKVRAANRDKLQIIKEDAKKGLFDILLVFMFDRIGRIADETPFVVEWFVKNGIRVWSTQEGEQRFDNHTDKLINYIRFWQADGESEKTSVRIRNALGLIVEDGFFKGGNAPYGYDLVPSGHFNKRRHEVLKLAVNESEAAVVRIIYNKYVHEGFGAQRIATYLGRQGYRARSGKMWHHASIRGILANPTYTGILRCGESHSPFMPELEIIPAELFEEAQRIRQSRSGNLPDGFNTPHDMSGKVLLSGKVFCGHCGSRLSYTASTNRYYCKDGKLHESLRRRYVCYGKTRKQTDCDGPTGYTVHILDGIVDRLVRGIFERMRSVPSDEIVSIHYREKMADRKALLESLKNDYAKASEDLITLKAEIVKSLRGESAFSEALLSSTIEETQSRCTELQTQLEKAEEEYNSGVLLMDSLRAQYDKIISWAVLYENADLPSKKMIINNLIKRIDVYRGYRLHIEFNIDLEHFSKGLDTDPENLKTGLETGTGIPKIPV